MLPDVDLVLADWMDGVHHHGVVHTVLAVTICAVVLGPIVGVAFGRIGERTGRFSAQAREYVTAIGFIVVWISGLSHLFADILSAPDVSTRIEPLWPVVTGPVVLPDVLWYQSWWATWGLFALGVAANVLAWTLSRVILPAWPSDGRRPFPRGITDPFTRLARLLSSEFPGLTAR